MEGVRSVAISEAKHCQKFIGRIKKGLEAALPQVTSHRYKKEQFKAK